MVILHNHLFKNGGSTIDWALERNFGTSFVDHRDDMDMLKVPGYLEGYLKQHPDVMALSSHHLQLPFPSIEGLEIYGLMMLRNPIERVTSVYNFERKQVGVDTPGARYAQEHSFPEYVRWRMAPHVGATIRNFHVLRSVPTEVGRRGKVDDEVYAQAEEFILELPLLGLLERFDESMVLFEEALRPKLSDIDLAYRVQNVSQDPRQPVEERLSKLKMELGDEVFAQLNDCNRYDLKLYAKAEQLLDQRIADTPDFAEKLDDYRERCACLS